MYSTAVFTLTLVSIFIASLTLWMLFLRLGLRWAQSTDVPQRRVFATALAVTLLQILVSFLSWAASQTSMAPQWMIVAAELLAATLLPCLIISKLFKLRLLRAFQAWLPTLFVPVAMLSVSVLLVRPYLFEAYVASTNSMAPTLLAEHWTEQCPRCKLQSYASPAPASSAMAQLTPLICENFHLECLAAVDQAIHPADRFLVAKFLAPRRWDIVAFQFPADPNLLYVDRIVGLPGEEIVIRDGSVWADGRRLVPPDRLREIQYFTQIANWFPANTWGTETQPALLGDKEFFVLGDFSLQSVDSRFWQQGAPGHNPFAVPNSHIQGVVTHTFWPLDRWRVHR